MRLLAVIMFCFACINLDAANWYLAAIEGSANHGTNWSDCWTNMSSVKFGATGLQAGDTLYVAGGFTYTNDSGQHYFAPSAGVSGTPGNPISVCRARATNTACSGAAGWSAAYDAVPIIDATYFSAGHSNYVFDGAIPYTGMMITNSVTAASSYNFDIRGGASFITVRNCEIVGYGYSDLNTDPAESRCWKTDGSALSFSNHLDHCILRNACTIISTANDRGMIVENCVLANTLIGPGSTLHPNLWLCVGTSNVLFRNCLITNYTVEGIMMGSVGSPCVNWDIYGNVFHNTSAGVSRILSARNDTNGPIRFFNNTIVTNYYGILTEGGAWTADCASSNNIYFGPGSVGFGIGTDDYNLTDHTTAGANSITNAIYANTFSSFTSFAITSTVSATLPRNKGSNLGAVYSIDANGNTRGLDGSWDIGAYEYVSPGPTTLNVTGSATIGTLRSAQ